MRYKSFIIKTLSPLIVILLIITIILLIIKDRNGFKLISSYSGLFFMNNHDFYMKLYSISVLVIRMVSVFISSLSFIPRSISSSSLIPMIMILRLVSVV